MIQMIKTEPRLLPYLVLKLKDAGMEVEMDPSLTPEQFAAIKVDDYYAGLKTGMPPKAVDFVVVVDCECNVFSMYVLELKNVNSPRLLNISEIQEKFRNTIRDFLSGTFSHIFLNDRFKYQTIRLYLVSDAYRIAGKFKNYEVYQKLMDKMGKKDSLKVDRALGTSLYRFRGRILKIEFDIPPNPIITR